MEQQQCVINICPKVPGQRIRKVTDWVWDSARDNQTLPAYLKVGDMICQRCYNGIIVHPSTRMKKTRESKQSI